MNAPNLRRITLPLVRLHLEATPDSPTSSELLFGETVDRLHTVGRWTRVRAHADGYEGFVATQALAAPVAPSTHRVSVRATLRFPARDIKSAPVTRLPLGALLRIEPGCQACEAGLLPVADGGFVPAEHVSQLQHRESASMVELVQRLFPGTPYLWGGRTPGGCDCSGLVQSVARLAGYALPRDSGPQEASIAQHVAPVDRQPNDLMFWPGHVALAMPHDAVIHANAHTLSVAVEPLSAVIERAGRPRSLRRLAAPVAHHEPASPATGGTGACD